MSFPKRPPCVLEKEIIHTVLNVLSRGGVEGQPFCLDTNTRTEDSGKCAVVLEKPLFVQVFCTDAKYSEHVTRFMDSDSSLLESKFRHSIHVFVCFTLRQSSKSFVTFNGYHTGIRRRLGLEAVHSHAQIRGRQEDVPIKGRMQTGEL